MNGIRIDHCAWQRAAANCLGAGIAMLLCALAVSAQHPQATQHPNMGCPHSHGHLPGHHVHHCQNGSTQFPYQAPASNDYQHWMRNFETQPAADLGDLATQLRQIKRIEEKVKLSVLHVPFCDDLLQRQRSKCHIIPFVVYGWLLKATGKVWESGSAITESCALLPL